MTLVLDGSVALAWCFEDEQTPAVMEVLDRVTAVGAFVPSHWPLEVLNGLLSAERRGRVSETRRRTLAGFLADVPASLDPDTASAAWLRVTDLAVHFRLTVYDAAYLELAARLGLPLATLDNALRRAATQMHLDLLGMVP